MFRVPYMNNNIVKSVLKLTSYLSIVQGRKTFNPQQLSTTIQWKSASSQFSRSSRPHHRLCRAKQDQLGRYTRSICPKHWRNLDKSRHPLVSSLDIDSSRIPCLWMAKM